jgi:small subunit ribosomal protein S2
MQKKATPSQAEEKPILENPKSKEKSIKTVQELDREKLEKKFSKKKKETLN